MTARRRGAAVSSPRTWAVVAILGGMVAFGLWSLSLGQDVNYDQRNYHIYNVWALMHSRLDYDSAPAGIQSFFSQYYNIPFFYLALNAPPRVTAFTMGAVHGINAGLVAIIAWTVVRTERVIERVAWTAAATAIGIWSPSVITGIGTSLGDLAVAVPAMAAVALLVVRFDRLTWRSGLVAGLGIGLSVALKQTQGPFGLGLILALALIAVVLRRRDLVRATAGMAGGTLAAFVAVSAYWSYEMWRRFDNPIYPLYNQIFRSSWYPAQAVSESSGRFVRPGPLELLTYPFDSIWTTGEIGPLPVRDWRWAVLIVLGGLALLTLVVRGLRRAARDRYDPRLALIVLTIALTYGIWLLLFRIERYLVCIELLSGIAAYALVTWFVRRRVLQATLLAAAGVAMCFPVRGPDYGHIPFGPSWYAVGLPQLALTPNAMVIMATLDPITYVIPTFPPKTRFVRVYATSFVEPNIHDDYTRAQDRLIAAHKGPFLLMARKVALAFDVHAAAYKGFERTDEPCQPIANHVDPMVLCPMRRVAPAP